jgi:glucan 1,3-beta-glucosidase
MYTMLGAFHDKLTAKRWLEHHWEHFVTISDVKTLYEAGVTHVRVPLPFWIRGDIQDDEPWVDGGWLYFVRFVSWCRQYNIQVWPDIHTAPSSQNGFDNSGQLLPGPTCSNWGNSDEHIERTLKAVQDISQAIMDDGLGDVVTGFGTLNEPFVDCSDQVLRDYNEKALKILRTVMGPKINVYVGDLFNSTRFADGWWTEKEYQNTYLDSHYYHGTSMYTV